MCGKPRQLSLEIEHITVLAQEHIAGHAAENGKGVLVVFLDTRIDGVMRERLAPQKR